LLLAGTGYFFSGAVTNLIGDIHKYGFVLVIIVATGIVGFYLLERFWLSKKVEEKAEKVDSEKIHTLEEPLHVTLHDLAEGIQERLHVGNSSQNSNGAAPEEAVPQPSKTQEPRKVESD
jgi:hypothetical protein